MTEKQIHKACEKNLSASGRKQTGEGKFIPIEGKDGKIRNYQADKYAELVARTRIAEAQTSPFSR